MTLSRLRIKIDKVDNLLIKTLAQREKIVQKIAKIKKKQYLPIINKKREQEIYNQLKKKAKMYHLEEKYLLQLFKLIIRYSRKIQK